MLTQNVEQMNLYQVIKLYYNNIKQFILSRYKVNIKII